jgi:hypothetical protein
VKPQQEDKSGGLQLLHQIRLIGRGAVDERKRPDVLSPQAVEPRDAVCTGAQIIAVRSGGGRNDANRRRPSAADGDAAFVCGRHPVAELAAAFEKDKSHRLILTI